MFACVCSFVRKNKTFAKRAGKERTADREQTLICNYLPIYVALTLSAPSFFQPLLLNSFFVGRSSVGKTVLERGKVALISSITKTVFILRISVVAYCKYTIVCIHNILLNISFTMFCYSFSNLMTLRQLII